MARSVGVELTDSSVRLLWLDQGGKKSRVLQFHEAPIPAEGDAPWEARASGALREAFAASKIPRVNVVASIDSGEAILREISLPFKGDEQIRKTVRFEMESQIHNYTIEQLVVAHYKTGESEKGSLLLGAALPKTSVEKRLKVLQDAGVDPAALDLDACAIFNAMLQTGAIDTDEPHLLVYGTSKFTKLILVEQKKPRSIRTIRFSLPSPEAGAAPESFGKLAQEGQRSLVEILAKEVSRFLLANAASATPAHILLSGAFEDQMAASMLESATRLPVKTFNLLEAVEHPFPEARREVSARMGVALGLALKGTGNDALGMDFRQDEFSYRRKFEAIKTTGLVTVELVVVMLAAVALYFYFRRDEVRAANATVLAEHKSICEEVSGEKISDPTTAFTRLGELMRRYEGPMGKGAPLEQSAREVWIRLFKALETFQKRYGPQTLGEGLLYVEVEGLDIRQNTTPGNESFELVLRGKVRNMEYAGKLKDTLREDELFQSAEYNGPFTPVSGENLNQFSLRVYKGRRGT
jgi:Tfp pilus assembly PilM family ATPase